MRELDGNQVSPHGEVTDRAQRAITLLVVDDQPQVRQGLLMLFGLQPDVEVLGSTGSGEQALELARQLQPDVILMDIQLPGIDGITVTQRLQDALPHSRVVILSLYGDPQTRRQAQLAGAAAFVAKHDMHETLLTTIRDVAMQQRPPHSDSTPAE